MANTIPWKKTLGAKLGATVGVLLAMTVMFVVAGLYALGSARRDVVLVELAAASRPRLIRALYLANRLADARDPEEKARFRAALDEVTRELEQRTSLLQH